MGMFASVIERIRKTGDHPRPSTIDFKTYLAFYNLKLWDGQDRLFEACERVIRGEAQAKAPLVAGPSGHNVGKTWGAAEYISYLLLKHHDNIGCTCLVLSPNKRITMTQVYGLVKQNCERFELFADITITDDAIKIGKSICVPVAIPRGRNASNDLQGYHNGVVFAVIDEGANMGKDVVQSLRSCASGGKSCVLILGNPISGVGADNALNYAARRAPDWAFVPLSSAEHPNVLTGREIIPGGISREYVNDIINANCFEYVQDTYDVTDLPIIGSEKTIGRRTGLLVKVLHDTGKFKAGQLVVAEREACRRIFGLIMRTTQKGGILPIGYFDNNQVSTELFFEAMARVKPSMVFMGLDPSGQGFDKGKLAILFFDDSNNDMFLAIAETMDKDRTAEYCDKIFRNIKRIDHNPKFVLSVDSTGGYGSGVCDLINSLRGDGFALRTDLYENINWFNENKGKIDLQLIEFNFAEACKTKRDKSRFGSYTAMVARHMKSTASVYQVYTFGFDETDIDGCYARVAQSDGRKFIIQSKKIHVAREGSSPDAFDAYLLCIVSLLRGTISDKEDDQISKEAQKVSEAVVLDNSGGPNIINMKPETTIRRVRKIRKRRR